MKTPKQFIAEVARSQAAFDRALAAYGRSKDRLELTTTRAESQRAMLAVAKSWSRLGDAARRIGSALEACVQDQRRSDSEVAA